MASPSGKTAPPISAGTKIREMIREYPETIKVLEDHGLWCPECALIGIATVELGAERHHLSLKKLLDDLNRAATRPMHGI